MEITTDHTTTGHIVVPIIRIYLVLWVVGVIVFYPGNHAAFKRWLWPRYMIGAGLSMPNQTPVTRCGV